MHLSNSQAEQEAQVGRIQSRVEFCLGERRRDRSGVGACGYKIVSVKKKRRRWNCMAGTQKSYVLQDVAHLLEGNDVYYPLYQDLKSHLRVKIQGGQEFSDKRYFSIPSSFYSIDRRIAAPIKITPPRCKTYILSHSNSVQLSARISNWRHHKSCNVKYTQGHVFQRVTFSCLCKL